MKNLLKIIRKESGKNQEQFAELVGVSFDSIKSVESGRARMTRKLWLKIYIAYAGGNLCQCDPTRVSYAFDPESKSFTCRICKLRFEGHQ
jgi:DNA-binding XRE family transcriptional regulator